MKKVLAVLAVAGLASAASAQSFTPQIAFRADHTSSTTATIQNGGVHQIDVTGLTAPQTFDFAIMGGVFNPQGFTNEGMYSWFGSLIGTGSGFSIHIEPTPSGVRPPFNFSPAGNGTTVPGGLANIDAARNPLVTTEWDEEAPSPDRPNWTQGRNAYFSFFRFRVTFTDLTAREIDINANGLMSAVADFFMLGGEPGGGAEWTAGPFVADVPANGGFTIALVPAPGAAALLGLGGLVAARRRRA